MKIGVYAPAKNELKHIQDWYASCKEADEIVVFDTGSSDGSVEAFKELPIKLVQGSIMPWRFDQAFNTAMSLLSSDVDIAIRLDLDERLQPGWREALESVWSSETTRLRYPYIWNWTDGKPDHQWYGDRIHSRVGYMWHGATHEYLGPRYGYIEIQTWTDTLQIHQFPDIKNKSQDVPLLYEAITEQPHDARFVLYLAREYWYRKNYVKSSELYLKYLNMPNLWGPEEAMALRRLADMNPMDREKYLKRAIEVADHRETLVDLAQHYFDIEHYDDALKYIEIALETERKTDYTSETVYYTSKPHLLASLVYWQLSLRVNKDLVKDYLEKGFFQAVKALEYEPKNEQFMKNIAHFKQRLNEHFGTDH